MPLEAEGACQRRPEADKGGEVARVWIGLTLDRFLALFGAVEFPAMVGGGARAERPPRFELPAATESGGAMRCIGGFSGWVRRCKNGGSSTGRCVRVSSAALSWRATEQTGLPALLGSVYVRGKGT
jgi:hypothetical protein